MGELRHLAASLRTTSGRSFDADLLLNAWDHFFGQLEGTGRRCLREGLLTTDYVSEVPPALLIGLPALVLFQVVARSPPEEPALVLASGFRLYDSQRPRSSFADDVWQSLMEAKSAYNGALPTMTAADRKKLEADLLAG